MPLKRRDDVAYLLAVAVLIASELSTTRLIHGHGFQSATAIITVCALATSLRIRSSQRKRSEKFHVRSHPQIAGSKQTGRNVAVVKLSPGPRLPR